jgi:hypothetical protein
MPILAVICRLQFRRGERMKKDGTKGELARNSRQFVRAKMNATGFNDTKFFQICVLH